MKRRNRPYSHKLLTINNYVNCPSNFAFARSIYLFHSPIFEIILIQIIMVYSRGFYQVMVNTVCSDVAQSFVFVIKGKYHNGGHSYRQNKSAAALCFCHESWGLFAMDKCLVVCPIVLPNTSEVLKLNLCACISQAEVCGSPKSLQMLFLSMIYTYVECVGFLFLSFLSTVLRQQGWSSNW